jgi:putative peptidoglycan lipid II flippase
MMIGIAAIGSNILFNFLLVGPLGLGGLALSIALASLVQVVLLFLYLRRAVEGVSLPYRPILKILLASSVMWGAFLLCQQVLPAGMLPAFAGMAAGAVAYLAALLLLRFEEMRFLVAKLARRR